MLYTINLGPAQAPPGAGFNIGVQVEAADTDEALELAKKPIAAAAKASAELLAASVPRPAPPA